MILIRRSKGCWSPVDGQHNIAQTCFNKEANTSNAHKIVQTCVYIYMYTYHIYIYTYMYTYIIYIKHIHIIYIIFIWHQRNITMVCGQTKSVQHVPPASHWCCAAWLSGSTAAILTGPGGQESGTRPNRPPSSDWISTSTSMAGHPYAVMSDQHMVKMDHLSIYQWFLS